VNFFYQSIFPSSIFHTKDFPPILKILANISPVLIFLPSRRGQLGNGDESADGVLSAPRGQLRRIPLRVSRTRILSRSTVLHCLLQVLVLHCYL
jgi:hypothetical protein